MGTCSYVLTGTEQGMTETFGTTCHGAVSLNKPVGGACMWLVLVSKLNAMSTKHREGRRFEVVCLDEHLLTSLSYRNQISKLDAKTQTESSDSLPPS